MKRSLWWLALAWLAPFGFSDPTASQPRPPAPVETFQAKDLPLNYKGATGQMANWLKAYDYKVEAFSYTMQLIRDDDKVRVYRVTFPSPFVSQWPENNTVPAEYYLPKNSAGKIPVAVVLDILDGTAVLPRMVSLGLAEEGVGAFYLSMPYYNERRPKDNGHIRALNDDPLKIIVGFQQSVMDIRRAKALLASRAEIDSNQIGITGISLGGIMTSLAAGVDGEFARVVPILSGGDLASITFGKARETSGLRALLEAKGFTQEKYAAALAPVEPLSFASRIDPKRCLMINAANDEVIPKTCTESLRKSIGDPSILWTPMGHYSSIWYLPFILQRTVDFIKGKEVKQLVN